ncbi:class I SAM-dependent methyltransferase [Acanthopleuribacter pedis]|uniref:Class I SAM-dependent methyltransferase n=1 Tax=Acanthopleuribacter pedis TaxID=442870 RepID=A0A8J7U242_9BACT|nr:class I SAM-dependent methyltransferase [Acanthopleuribacter pedis]MBO1318212.1 class I SAM-dependent methyltransferase [Acanthopleuribacter pedis]
MDILEHNRNAWNGYVESGNEWTRPVDAAAVAAARAGDWQVVLTPTKPVPRDWFPDLSDCDLLGLACGGGQQGPLFAAAGARVTIFDNSPAQLARDAEVAAREGLTIQTVQGDMADLSCFPDASFDLVFNPCSVVFVPDVAPIQREAARVLRPGGLLMMGFTNPALFVFDYAKSLKGELEVRHKIPYADTTDLSEAELAALTDKNEAMTFGHSLDSLIGGQLAAGLLIKGFFEDAAPEEPLSRYMNNYIATCAVKPG